MTIPIRIRVRTDELGNWAAYGRGGPRGGGDSFHSVIDDGKKERWTWVLADVPLPESESEVQATLIVER